MSSCFGKGFLKIFSKTRRHSRSPALVNLDLGGFDCSKISSTIKTDPLCL